MLLIFAGLASGCIPKERPEEERSTATLTRAGESLPAVGGASPANRDPEVSDVATRHESKEADRDPPITGDYVDRFERGQLGSAWRATSSAWRLEGGRLCAEGARNRPAWLARRIPTNARVEFDAISLSADGDIKAELWGDGLSGATGVTYDHATSYLVIFGGWKNRFHVLARLNEHANDRTEIVVDPNGRQFRTRPVVANRLYHFTVERIDGHTVRWLVNGEEVAVLDDQNPLVGATHDHIGFNNWETLVCFDNLSITPL